MEIQRPLIRATVILAAALVPVLLLQAGRRADDRRHRGGAIRTVSGSGLRR